MFYIYAISLRDSNKCYVGCTHEPTHRLANHIGMLCRGEHHCDSLQEHFDKVGMKEMIFQIIDICGSVKEAHNAEKFTIQKYDVFNTIVAGIPLAESETRKNLRLMKMATRAATRIKGPTIRKKVIRSDGAIFPSVAAAAKSVGSVDQRVSDCCHGRSKSFKGFGWAFYDEEDKQKGSPT